jgi:hypothetical protein
MQVLFCKKENPVFFHLTWQSRLCTVQSLITWLIKDEKSGTGLS